MAQSTIWWHLLITLCYISTVQNIIWIDSLRATIGSIILHHSPILFALQLDDISFTELSMVVQIRLIYRH